jgi:2-methylcitrate dehydratase PrpD
MIDALLSVTQAQQIAPEAIEGIGVFTHRFAADLNEQAPATLTAAKSSLPFCAALAVVKGGPLLVDFTMEALADERVRALARRTTIEMDPALDARHGSQEDRRPARVEIALKDGRRLVAERDVARGWPEDPLDPQEIAAKFRALVEPGYGSAQSRDLLDTIASLEDLDDVNGVGRTLAAATPA